MIVSTIFFDYWQNQINYYTLFDYQIDAIIAHNSSYIMSIRLPSAAD